MSQIRHPSANCRPASCLLLFRHQRHLTLDETIKRNPQALVQLCLVPLKPECVNLLPMSAVTIWFRYRLYGAFVGLRKISRRRFTTNTTWLGEEAARNTRILERRRA